MSTITSDETGQAGLTEPGRSRAVPAHCTLEGDREGRGAQRKSLRAMFDALVRRDGPLSKADLQRYFRASSVENTSTGHYTRAGQFYDEVGRAQLLSIPGVEEARDGLRFVGADPNALDVDAEFVRPLDDVRASPRTKARNTLDERVGPQSGTHEDLLLLWDAIASSGHIEEDRLERRQRLSVSEDTLDVLADLPGIEREVSHPPEPEEIEVETYADVLDAQTAIDQADGPEVVWRFTPDDGSA